MADDTLKIVGKNGLFDATGVKGLNAQIKELETNFDKLADTLKTNEKELKEVAKLLEKSATKTDNDAKKVIELTDATKELNAAYKENQKQQKQLEVASEKLNKVRSGQSDELIKIRLQTQIANKEAKERIKDSEGLVNAYDKESKRLNDLRKEAKNTGITLGRTSKEFKQLQKEVNELDEELKDLDSSLGQNQRRVGNYERALGGLSDGLGDVSDGLKDASKSADGLTGKLSSAASKIPVVGTVIAGIGSIATSAFGETEEGAEGLNKAVGTVEGVWESLKQSVSGAVQSFKDGDDVIDSISNNFGDFTEKVDKNTESYIKQQKAERELQIAQTQQSSTLAELITKYEILTQKSGDSTIALEDQQKASEDAARVNLEISKIQEGLIKREIANNESRISLAEQNERKLADTNELIVKRSELEVSLVEAQKETLKASKELTTEQRQIDQDIFEQRLDFLIDFSDNIKSVNERIIANERISTSERQALLTQTVGLQEEAFAKQKELFNEQAGVEVDFQRLSKLSAEQLFTEVEALKLSEIERTRLLEVLREENTLRQDLVEAQQDLNDERNNENLTRELAKEQKLFNLQLEGAKENAEQREQIEKDHQDRILQIQIDSLNKQLENSEEGSIREAELLLEIEELKTEQLQFQVVEQKKINGLTDEQKHLADAALSSLADMGTQFIKNEQAANILSATLDAIIQNLIANNLTGTGVFGGAGKAGRDSVVSQGFAHGGYTGDGGKFEEAGTVHKGEFVIDKETTSMLGLQNASMSDVHRALDSDRVAKEANEGQKIHNIISTPKITQQAEKIDYDRLAQSVASAIPEHDFAAVGDHYVSTRKELHKVKKIVHKSPNSSFSPKMINNSCL